MSGGFWLGRRDGDFENPGQREMPWHVGISGSVGAGRMWRWIGGKLRPLSWTRNLRRIE